MGEPGKAVLNESDVGGAEPASFYRERRPAVPHPFVECWWEQRVDDRLDGYVQRVVPDACADVIVSSGGEVIVAGPAMSVHLARLAGGERLRGLRLRTAAIGAALGLPAHELRDLQVQLRDLFPAARTARIADQVWRGEPPSALASGAFDPRVGQALVDLRRPTARVAGVAADLGISERHLRRLVVAHTGLDPKTLQRVGRLQRFLALSDRATRARPPSSRAAGEWSLADLAARAGYADQAHLSREVRSLSGLTPSALLAERRLTP